MRGPPEQGAEASALDRLVAASDAIATGVEAALPGWVGTQIDRLLDAWSGARAGAGDVAPADGEISALALEAAAACTTRIVEALRALFALDPRDQHTTPLEVVRTAVREPTDVLRAAGVAEVARDDFDVRAFPDDRYNLVPRTLGDLGDPELGPLQLEWGLAKVAVLRSRSDRHA